MISFCLKIKTSVCIRVVLRCSLLCIFRYVHSHLREQGHRYAYQKVGDEGMYGFLPGTQKRPLLRWQRLHWRCCRFPLRSPAEIVPTAESQNHGVGRPPVGRYRSLGGIGVPNSRYCRSDDGAIAG